MITRWANPQKIGVIIMRDGVAFYVDGGPEYDAEIKAGPADYVGLTFDDETQEQADARVNALRAAMQMTFAQLLIGLVAMGWITKPEGIAWLGGTVPAAVNTLIASLPVDQQFAALARAVRPSVVQRLDGLVLALAAIQGRSPTQMDAFFVTYAAI